MSETERLEFIRSQVRFMRKLAEFQHDLLSKVALGLKLPDLPSFVYDEF